MSGDESSEMEDMDVEEGDEAMSEQGQDEMMPGTGDEDGEQSQHQQRQDGSPGRGREPLYEPYNLEFDEIIEAEDLCDPDELNRLRHHLDQQLANLQGIIGWPNRLQCRFLLTIVFGWLEEGLLMGRLSRGYQPDASAIL